MDKFSINLSLLAQYDDLCRHLTGLSKGCEREFKIYIESQKHFRLKVKSLESENKKLKQIVNNLESDKLRLEGQLKQARSILITEVEKSQKLEVEKSSLERQIALIKELLADQNGIDHTTKEKLVQLSSAASQYNDLFSNLRTIEQSGSLLSSSDCDETTDEVDSCSKSKTNSDTMLAKSKMLRRSSTYLGFGDDSTEDETVMRRKSMVTFRSSSEPNSTSPEKLLPRQMIRSDSEQIRDHAFEERKSFKHNRSSLPTGRYSNGGKLSKAHTFQTKTFIRSEKCHPCGKIIKFCKQGAKCSVCRISCHTECRDLCPLPCIPVVFIHSKGTGTIADYTSSSSSPMIPSLIVHCINEIEARGFQDIGLYRVPGREREIKELKEKFLKGKTVPSLNEVDIHAVCGTVKEFLRSLKDSLIPKAAWHIFVESSSQCNEKNKLNLMYEAVCDLPQPNRETLAFLILHLQRVAASPLCKMPLDNLSKVFAPTVVGYSVDEPSDANMFSETQLQNKVMEGLLKIPADWWQNLFSGDSRLFSSNVTTPESLSAPVGSRLGPIYSSNTYLSAPATIKGSLSPRSAKAGGRTGRRQPFLSPIIKN